MLKVGQRIKLSDGIFRVKEVDNFKAKVVQEETEIREFTTRFDKKVHIKAKPKVKYISPNAELKILKDKPLKAEPKQKLKTSAIKINKVAKLKSTPKKSPVVKPKPVAAKKITTAVKKSKPVVSKKTTASPLKTKRAVANKTIPPVKKLKQAGLKKTTAPVVKPKWVAVKKITTPVKKLKQVAALAKTNKKSELEPDKFGQYNLF